MFILKRLSIVLFVMLFLICGLSFNASAFTLVEGDFGFEMNTFTKEMTLVEYYGSDTDVKCPNNYTGYPVTKISKRAFSGNSFIQSIEIPLSVRRLEKNAFAYCESLVSVTIPKSVNELGSELFLGCSSLNSVRVNTTSTELPDYCFSGCTSLESVELSDSTQTIGEYAFQDCSNMKSILIPRNVVTIKSYAFDNCELETIQGYMDSYAEEYADSKGIDFEAIDAIVGDANYDKTLNIQDVTAIQKYKAGLTTLSKSGLKAADVTGDGEVSVRDATQIQRYLANIITDF